MAVLIVPVHVSKRQRSGAVSTSTALSQRQFAKPTQSISLDLCFHSCFSAQEGVCSHLSGRGRSCQSFCCPRSNPKGPFLNVVIPLDAYVDDCDCSKIQVVTPC